MPPVVYIQAPDGMPLMPTKRFGKVRRLLKNGGASVVFRKPFTIRLKEEPSGRYTQDVVLGIDPGRTNIGTAAAGRDGACLFRGKLETRNRDIRKLMEERRADRQASRRGERLAKKRLAFRNGTATERFNGCGRMLPGCDSPVMLKDIINTESRFRNRKRPEGWLTPSARQLIQTHLSVVSLIGKILPVGSVSMEINRFAFMELEAGHRLSGDEFQNGRLKGYLDVNDAVYDLQKGKCLLCGRNGIEHYHHMLPKHCGGSNTIQNIAGLCSRCHALVHTSPDAAEQLSGLHMKLQRRYDGTSLLNTAIPFLMDALRSRFPGHFYVVTGTQTAEFRRSHSIGKDHDTDAYAIACAGAGIDGRTPGAYTCDMRQYRNHDRALIQAQTERTYYLGGKAVAKNRRPRFEQKGPALSDWYEQQVLAWGRKKAGRMLSQLSVRKSMRRYNKAGRLLPGTLFGYMGEVHVMSGQLTNGHYFRSRDDKKTNYPALRCRIIRRGGGIVFV